MLILVGIKTNINDVLLITNSKKQQAFQCMLISLCKEHSAKVLFLVQQHFYFTLDRLKILMVNQESHINGNLHADTGIVRTIHSN